MNHYRHYSNLIKRARERNSGVEAHHIFPRAIFGDNDKVVLLTLREHWVAHKLLFHICDKRYGKHPYTYKMANAVVMMGNRTSRTYELGKQFFTENHHTRTEEGRKLIIHRMKGNQHTKGKKLPPRTTSHREKNRQAHNKTYEITYNTGDKCVIIGMKQFALSNGYNASHLAQVAKGNRKRHKDIIGVSTLD
jgi:hypothetical protein